MGGGRLAEGVELDGVVELAVGVASAVGAVGAGELEGLALGEVADTVGLAVSEAVGVGLPAGVELSDGPGAGLSTGVEVSAGVGVRLAGDGVGTLGVIAGVCGGPSTEEARGKESKNKSPANDRTLAGLNRGTFTPSS